MSNCNRVQCECSTQYGTVPADDPGSSSWATSGPHPLHPPPLQCRIRRHNNVTDEPTAERTQPRPLHTSQEGSRLDVKTPAPWFGSARRVRSRAGRGGVDGVVAGLLAADHRLPMGAGWSVSQPVPSCSSGCGRRRVAAKPTSLSIAIVLIRIVVN